MALPMPWLNGPAWAAPIAVSVARIASPNRSIVAPPPECPFRGADHPCLSVLAIMAHSPPRGVDSLCHTLHAPGPTASPIGALGQVKVTGTAAQAAPAAESGQ